MKRIHQQDDPAGPVPRGAKGAVSELSLSMRDMSVHKPDINHVPVPRLKASVSKEKRGGVHVGDQHKTPSPLSRSESNVFHSLMLVSFSNSASTRTV